MRRQVALALLIIAIGSPASAQISWKGRTHVTIDGGIQADTSVLDESISLRKNAEPAPLTASSTQKASPLVEAGVTVRLTKRIGLGVALSYLSGTGTAAVAAEIPNPFLFNMPRPINGQVPDVNHSETAIHPDFVYFMPLSRVDLAFSGGPSIFRVGQDLVTDVAYTDVYPYDTATFSGATLMRVSATRVGFNAATDVTWRLSRRWGVGGLIRYARARVPFTITSAGANLQPASAGSMVAGGLQATGGLRMTF